MGLSNRRLNVVSVIGYLSLAVGLVVAHNNPATRYELSIYEATPVLFWISISISFFSALVISFFSADGHYRFLGVLLGSMSSLSVVSLPLIRGYYFDGIHDGVTHVGLTRELSAGSMIPFDLLYPGIHTHAAFITGITGFTTWRSVMIVTTIIVIVFFVFVPLVVGELIDGDMAITAGAFSAFMVAPTHLLANTTQAHPSSQTILFGPVVLFLLIRYLRSDGSNRLVGPVSAVGIAFLLSVFAAILFHPQQALNIVVVLCVICLFQFTARTQNRFHWPQHRRIYTITGVSGIAYLAWILQSPTVFRVIEGAVSSFAGYFTGTSPQAGSSVTSQTSALQSIGTSLPVIFTKLFFVSTVFVVLTTLVMVAAFSNRLNRNGIRSDSVTLIRYLGLSLIAMLPIFVFYFSGDVAKHYFREAGFMLMIGTVLGAFGIVYGCRAVSNTQLRRTVRSILICGFGVMLLLSMHGMHDSPYINKASQHVTEARVSGYETTFEMTNETALMAGIRQEPQRYYEGLVSIEDNNRRNKNINNSQIRNLTAQRSINWYLAVHSNTYEREIVAYEEYRFSEEDLTSIQRQRGVNRIHSNGDMELYYVAGASRNGSRLE